MKTPVLQIDSVGKNYHSTVALKEISFIVEEGEILSIIGPNGAGKTSLIKLIAGIIKPSSGTIKVGYNSNGKSVWQLIGYCPQQNVVWQNLNCLEQLMILAKLYSLKESNINKYCINLLEKLGLGNKLYTKASSLSGGMQKRLSVALSIVHSPKILILDEPFAGLDPYSRKFLRDFLGELHTEKNTTILVSTHDLTEADYFSTKVAIMNKGILLKYGNPNELKSSLGGRFVLEIPLESAPTNLVKDLDLYFENHAQVLQNGKFTVYFEDFSSLIQSDISNISSLSNGSFPYSVRPISIEDVFYYYVKENPIEDPISN